MLKRSPLDAVFSDLIRESYDWTCQFSGLQFPERKGRDVHCSHFISRGYNATRWFPDNCVCLSAASHDYLGKNPDEHDAFMRRHLGDTRYEMLRERKRQIFRYRPHDKKAMQKHYRDELERIRELRVKGVCGPVEVVAWD